MILALGAVLAMHRALLRPAMLLQAVGIALLGAAGTVVWLCAAPIGSAFTSSVGPAVGIDRLTGFFLALLGVTAAPAVIFAAGALADGVGRQKAIRVQAARA